MIAIVNLLISNIILLFCWFFTYRKWRYYADKYFDLLDKLNKTNNSNLN